MTPKNDPGRRSPDLDGEHVLAAGALPWRRRKGRLEVALVHRPKYDDWGWAKGKLEPREGWPAAAVREVLEETGLQVRLGIPLPTGRYDVLTPVGTQPKVVRYWAAQVVGDPHELAHEIDEVRWLSVPHALRTLSYRHDRAQARRIASAAEHDQLATWPMLLVRHAKATPRRLWSGEDWLRPLDQRGFAQSVGLVPLLQAYGVVRVVTSSATRCLQTVQPFCEQTGIRPRANRWLSEEGYTDEPQRALGYLRDAFRRGQAAAICTHGPLISQLLDRCAARLGPKRVRRHAEGAELLARTSMIKGEVIVMHVRGRDRSARIVAVESHLPIPIPQNRPELESRGKEQLPSR